jgi:squalene cyclase
MVLQIPANEGNGMLTRSQVRLVLMDEHEGVSLPVVRDQTRPQPAVRTAIFRARAWLIGQRRPEGFWLGDVHADVRLESKYIVLQSCLGGLDCHRVAKTARHIVREQLADGGWARYCGGPMDQSTSVLAYAALKLAGFEPHTQPMQRAREAILRAGGADAAEGWTRHYLALAGTPCVRELFLDPPELWPAAEQTAEDEIDALVARLAGQTSGDGACASALCSCVEQLERQMIAEGDALRIQPFCSPLADTAEVLLALCDAGLPPDDPAVREPAAWLAATISAAIGNTAAPLTHSPTQHSPLTTHPHSLDCSTAALSLLALVRQFGDTPKLHHIDLPGLRLMPHCDEGDALDDANSYEEHLSCATTAIGKLQQWLLEHQNADGGWGRGDESTPDSTGQVLEALAAVGLRTGVGAIGRAIDWLRQCQQADGSWSSQGGVHYVHGTSHVLAGLCAAGVAHDHPAIQAAVNWLVCHQQPCGGWGESPASCENRRLRGQGPVTSTQTAWALVALMTAGHAQHAAVVRGVRYLVSAQDDDVWHEPEFTSRGTSAGNYVRRDLHRAVWPLLAVARWAVRR